MPLSNASKSGYQDRSPLVLCSTLQITSNGRLLHPSFPFGQICWHCYLLLGSVLVSLFTVTEASGMVDKDKEPGDLLFTLVQAVEMCPWMDFLEVFTWFLTTSLLQSSLGREFLFINNIRCSSELGVPVSPTATTATMTSTIRDVSSTMTSTRTTSITCSQRLGIGSRPWARIQRMCISGRIGWGSWRTCCLIARGLISRSLY